MADPRLQWRQISTPQANVAPLLRNANQSFNNAAEAANNILGKYQAGQEAKGDAEAAHRLAGINDEAELDAFLAGGGLSDLTISKEMQASLLGTRKDALGYQNDRSIIRNRDGRLRIDQDGNSRANELFGFQREDRVDALARRDFQRKNADLFIEGERNAFNNGLSFSTHIDRTESGGGGDKYDTLYGHQNRTNGVRVSNMTIGEAGQFASTSGQYGQSVNDQIGRVATPMGKFQIVGSTLRGLQKDLNLPDDTPFSAPVQEQLGLYLAQQRVSGPRSRESMRQGLRAEWAGFKKVSDADLDVMIDEIRSTPLVSRESILAAAQSGQQPQPQSGFQATPRNRGGQVYADAAVASGLFTGSETLGLIDPIRKAAIAGQAEIDDQRLLYQNDVLAGVVEQVSNSSQAINLAESENLIRETLRQNGGFTQAEADKAARRGAALIGESAGLTANLGGTPLDAGQVGNINSAAENTIADAQRRLNGTDQARAVADIRRYSEGGEPHKILEADLGIPTDSETLGSYRPEMLRRLVNEYANEFGVEPAVVAVAMRDAYTPDPGDDEFSSFWYDSDLTINTLSRRFDKDAVEAAVAQLDPNARRDFDRSKSQVSTMESQLKQNASQQQTVLQRLNKLDSSNPKHTKRIEQLLNQLQTLENNAAVISRNLEIEER